jgi:hypothetical protein
MSEMVERVAKAIADADGDYTAMDHHRGRARAAIAAMREPTREMIDAAYKRDYYDNGLSPEVAWQTMIDETLK